MPKNQKLSLLAIFSFGFFTVSLSIVRMGWLNIDRGVDDDSYYNIEAASWSIGELVCGVIVTCLPTLRPLLFRTGGETLPGASGRTPRSGGSNNSNVKSYGASNSASQGRSVVKTDLDSTWQDELEKGYATASLETVRVASSPRS
jgi:hypothetical protein